MKKHLPMCLAITVFTIFTICAFCFGIQSGQRAAISLFAFTKQMLLILPFAFVCISLFEVWIKKETVERYLGHSTGFSAYLLAIALAGTTVGGIFVALPFAASLYRKGAKPGVVFTYLSCAGICRIPMTVFEASFLGIQFTLVRYAVSLPLVVVTSWLMEKIFRNINCEPLNKTAAMEP